MIIKDTERLGRYFKCNNAVMEDEMLSLKAKGLMGYLVSKPPSWRICKAHLMKVLRVGKKALNAIFDELVESGYAVQNNGEWDIYEIPTSGVQKGPSVMGSKGTLGGVRKEPDEGAKRTFGGVQKEPLVSTESKEGRVRKEESKETPFPPSSLNSEELSDSDSTDLSEEPSNKHSSNGSSKELSRYHSTNPPALVPKSTELIEQAKAVLSCHPMPKNAPESIRDISEAIQEHGYEPLMAATKSYAEKCSEGTFKPSWSNFWYKEGHFLEYLPAHEEPFQEREYDRPDYLTPEMETLALEDMNDVVYAIYKNFNPKYEYDESDEVHFMETAKLCFYRDLIPYSVVRSNQGEKSHRSPSRLHGKNAEANSLDIDKGGNTRHANVFFWQDYYAREIESLRKLVEKHQKPNLSMTKEDILLDPSVALPAWYRVVACSPDSPRCNEIVESWRKQGMCEILSEQVTGLVEALFSLDRIYASNLFPYYVNRYVKAKKFNGRSSTSMNALLELAHQSEQQYQRKAALAA